MYSQLFRVVISSGGDPEGEAKEIGFRMGQSTWLIKWPA